MTLTQIRTKRIGILRHCKSQLAVTDRWDVIFDILNDRWEPSGQQGHNGNCVLFFQYKKSKGEIEKRCDVLRNWILRVRLLFKRSWFHYAPVSGIKSLSSGDLLFLSLIVILVLIVLCETASWWFVNSKDGVEGRNEVEEDKENEERKEKEQKKKKNRKGRKEKKGGKRAKQKRKNKKKRKWKRTSKRIHTMKNKLVEAGTD